MKSPHPGGLRTCLRAVLLKAGLLGAIRRFRRRLEDLNRFFRDPEIRRRERADRQRFQQFKYQYGNVLRRIPSTANGPQKKVLILSRHFTPIEIQLVLLKALELAGFLPVVLTISGRRLVQESYRLAGVRTICDWSSFTEPLDFSAAAEAAVNRCVSVEEILAFEHAGIRCGRTAVSNALRQLRTGTLNLQLPQVRWILASQLASSMVAATAAQAIFRKIRPQLMLSFDVEYTPGSELFDRCMENGVQVITYREGHKNSTLILKRYSPHNRVQNPVSLSEESWGVLSTMAWSDARRNELREELHGNYASGNWYGVSGTQFDTHFMDATALRKRLGVSPEKKTAFIFPHIPWDASFRWGRDLFRDHEEWLLETVRAACSNEKVNWVIKIHPANVGKQLKGKYQEEPAEVVALRSRFGKLPPHVFLIPADSDISTYSLFALMDYCVTVRGTIGIEAASFGIPVITAGTGRYERKGFTIDPESREAYLDRLARIQEIGPLSPAERELAERFAYGIFLLRPFPLRAISVEFGKDYGPENGFTRARINIASQDGWREASDLKAFAHWINDSRNPDFLLQV